jgi:hypothetical protein
LSKKKAIPLPRKKKNLLTFSLPTPPFCEPKPKKKNPNILAWGTAIYSYTAQNSEELSFYEGEVIGITAFDENGWSRGTLNGQEGLFPTTYVETYVEGGDTTQTSTPQVPAVDDEQAKRRREKKEEMKQEMRGLKSDLQNALQTRDRLEKEVKSLTEMKQKLKKELVQSKAKMSDQSSVTFDLIQLAFALDVRNDALDDFSNATQVSAEAIQAFNLEFQKDAKGVAPLTPFAQKLASKCKELKDQGEVLTARQEDNDRAARDFRVALDFLIRGLQKK